MILPLGVHLFSSVQLLSCVQLFLTPWTAACQASLSITKFTQTYVHWVSDTIQPSHPLSFPSPPALSLSQHQCRFQGVCFSHQVAKVSELQRQNFHWKFRVDFLYNLLVWFPCCPGDSQESRAISLPFSRSLLHTYPPREGGTSSSGVLSFCLFILSWGSLSKNNEVVSHSLLHK